MGLFGRTGISGVMMSYGNDNGSRTWVHDSRFAAVGLRECGLECEFGLRIGDCGIADWRFGEWGLLQFFVLGIHSLLLLPPVALPACSLAHGFEIMDFNVLWVFIIVVFGGCCCFGLLL